MHSYLEVNLFCLIRFITSHQQSFSYIGMGLTQRHSAVTTVRLEPETLQSLVKHSTIEPPSKGQDCIEFDKCTLRISYSKFFTLLRKQCRLLMNKYLILY